MTPVATSHDAAEPVAYVFDDGERSAAVCTDTGIVTPLLEQRLQGCELLFLETNHDKDMLRHGPYTGVAGWFISEGRRGRDGQLHSPQITAAKLLAPVARSVGIDVTERYEPGAHTWTFGALAWGQVIAWLHQRIDDPVI